VFKGRLFLRISWVYVQFSQIAQHFWKSLMLSLQIHATCSMFEVIAHEPWPQKLSWILGSWYRPRLGWATVVISISWGRYQLPRIWDNLLRLWCMCRDLDKHWWSCLDLRWKRSVSSANEEPAKLNCNMALWALWPNSLFSKFINWYAQMTL
jgi:hypothetical protein